MQSEILPIEIGVPLDDWNINRQKYVLPIEIKIMICNYLILSHINYCIMTWGYKDNRMMIIKKAVRIITFSRYNSHTEPLKNLNY